MELSNGVLCLRFDDSNGSLSQITDMSNVSSCLPMFRSKWQSELISCVDFLQACVNRNPGWFVDRTLLHKIAETEAVCV